MTNKPSDKPTPEEMAREYLKTRFDFESDPGSNEAYKGCLVFYAEGLKAGQGELAQCRAELAECRLAKPNAGSTDTLTEKYRLREELTQAKARIQDACRDYMKEREAALGLVELLNMLDRQGGHGLKEHELMRSAIAAYKARNGGQNER